MRKPTTKLHRLLFRLLRSMLRAVKLRKTVRLHVCCTLINSIEPAGHYACIQNSHNNKHFLIAELSEEDRKYIIGNPNGYWGADCASN